MKPGPITTFGETYYPALEAARMLGISKQLLYYHIRRGNVRATALGPKRIGESEIKRLLNGEQMPEPEIETTEQRKKETEAIRNRLKKKKGW